MGPLIDVRHLTKRYDHQLVLDDLALTVERGETCVIGGSGSGKTTFARLLVGLERPDSGEIRVCGVDIVGLRGRELDRTRRKFAFVFQKDALLDSMSVFDNVAFPLREERRLSAEQIRARVSLVLRELEVEEAATKLPGELSGGMAKRVGIARAVVTEPEILVYDEPTTGLDPVSSRIVDGLIERMRVVHGVTSVVITHDMVTAYEVADRVVLLAGGKALAQGPPEELFRSHRAEIEPFVRASGVDPATLPPRSGRPSPADIRARWEASHPLTASGRPA
jgi:phospholipid/cholesterol/gamma-HCH transport system ATP-binding protein